MLIRPQPPAIGTNISGASPTERCLDLRQHAKRALTKQREKLTGRGGTDKGRCRRYP